MTVQNPEPSPRDADASDDSYAQAPTSSFLQMFLEARPPRDDSRARD